MTDQKTNEATDQATEPVDVVVPTSPEPPAAESDAPAEDELAIEEVEA